ncbi:MAG: MBL fold metallo-hydrolase [Defluviitaleaceae bacterium]|nr:MBL fold metallo-hydrolase [Defluviitaleaceae bacterium]
MRKTPTPRTGSRPRSNPRPNSRSNTRSNSRTMPTRRRIPTRRRRRRTRRSGRGFFLAALAILIFAIIYIFAGDRIFPPITTFFITDGEEIIVSFLDVGQGDSVVVRSAGNTVLIDGGEHGARGVVISYLNEAGITRLCYVVATHPHSDHIGGLVQILRDFEIGSVIKPDISHEAQYTQVYGNFLEAIHNNAVHVIHPSPGDRLQAGIIHLEVISPPATMRSINDQSIVLRLEHGQTSFLFTGDAESPAERWMVDSRANISSDVLHVGHHGSRTSTTESFLLAVAPEIAVISVGENNRHGHPHQEVTDSLRSHGIEILRTDELGTIRMLTDGNEITRKENTPQD